MSDPRGDCAASSVSTCGSVGYCNGSGACAMAPAGTICNATPTCDSAGTSLIVSSICNGAGACVPGTPVSCDGFSCASGACATALQRTFSVTTASGAWDLAYDIWLDTAANTSTQNNGAEIMIWLNSAGANPGGFPNIVKSGVCIDGHTYDIYETRSSGSGVQWNLVSYRANPAVGRVDIDVKHFINDAISRGFASNAWFLTSIQAGTEIWQGGAGLKLNAFGASVK